jgi:hypothetical protein
MNFRTAITILGILPAGMIWYTLGRGPEALIAAGLMLSAWALLLFSFTQYSALVMLMVLSVPISLKVYP